MQMPKYYYIRSVRIRLTHFKASGLLQSNFWEELPLAEQKNEETAKVSKERANGKALLMLCREKRMIPIA
jgi:hypothetical protein